MLFNMEEYNRSVKGPKNMDFELKHIGDIPINNHIDNEIKAYKLKCSKLHEDTKKINTTLSYIKAYKMLTGQVIFKDNEGLLIKKPANYIGRFTD